ncbi:MAG: hypothetical protein ACREXQ_16220, partial [Polaromonas sp.]
GFRALRSVLKDDGAIGLMVYATTGRTGVYQLQALMRLVNGEQNDDQRKIANTRDLLASLPPSNWFMRGEDLHHDHKAGDAGIYDLLLHSQDRSYTVGELFDWLGDEPDNGPGKGQACTWRSPMCSAADRPICPTWCWAANHPPWPPSCASCRAGSSMKWPSS